MWYTIVPSEMLLDEGLEPVAPWVDQPIYLPFEDDESSGASGGPSRASQVMTEAEREIRLGDVLLVVEPLPDDPCGRYRVVRVVSSNPQAYLHPFYQPGMIWPFA
ncbi:MAG TPA: hypothetical protein GXX55_07555 [Firmicutes bacterium]|nr:hypothetical protein [Bacillota bacterium]